MQKRGYFFELDAALALFVLVLGAFYIASYYIAEPEISPAGLLSNDLLSYLSDTQIKNLDNPYGGIGGELWKNGTITNSDNSILQQAGEFYSKNKRDILDSFLRNVTNEIVPFQFRYEIWINNEIVYPQLQPIGHNASKGNTTLLLVSRKIAYGVSNTSTWEMWGPYEAQVFMWQR